MTTTRSTFDAMAASRNMKLTRTTAKHVTDFMEWIMKPKELTVYDLMDDYEAALRIENRYGDDLSDTKKRLAYEIDVVYATSGANVRHDIELFLDKYNIFKA